MSENEIAFWSSLEASVVFKKYAHYTIEEFDPTRLPNVRLNKRIRRLINFGPTCVFCLKQAKYFVYGKIVCEKKHEVTDLYTEDFVQLTIDHIKPTSRGGTDGIKNLQCLCYSCNSQKGNSYAPRRFDV